MPKKGGPNKPKPKAVSLAVDETAIAVLDLSARCQDPKEVCWNLMKPLGKFLERARARGVAIIYTISAHTIGTPMQEVALPLRRRDTEPVIYPDSFDKFFGGEGNDRIYADGSLADGFDTIVGGDGDDLCMNADDGAGGDKLDGGAGDDAYWLDPEDTRVNMEFLGIPDMCPVMDDVHGPH